ncbi:Alpha-tubulin N-acetyltransferase 1 [Phytophthora boehmeriae]|uniref:Alpha-tubulin N-acetyltransferase n=1 Tax=Phytophthora boehmeriae TaxID=109152 RepID=A0A8T1VW20_9STRA|nr:Alpha-tubulin N-acetyltransferase 1 [Phytophthora boehmeriae]
MVVHIEVIRAPEALQTSSSLAQAVDILGRKSALAQALSQEITSTALFVSAASEQRQRLLLAKENDTVVGFLKTGVKHLFYVSRTGEYIEIDPICVLDFYVDEAYQRCGVGLQLFQRLLQEEDETPQHLAYDRPSPKLFAFLQKHAGLTEHFPQPNRFVVFDAYFQPCQ